MSARNTSHCETALESEKPRIGIDLGGSKIEGVLMGPAAAELARYRVPTPRNDYAATIAAIVDLKLRLMHGVSTSATIGIAVPGSISPVTGLMQNANSTWLNGRTFDRDLAAAFGTPVRLSNDANCFALSEAMDGAGENACIVFGVILGTGCGGGLVVNGRLLNGPRGIGGEWGHNPLPWAQPDEYPGPDCWCGRRGCLETWVSGPGMAADHETVSGERYTAKEIAARAAGGDDAASATRLRHADRLARGLAHVVNVVDPDVVVLGGGLSQLSHLYEQLPDLMRPHVFADQSSVTIKPNNKLPRPVDGDLGALDGLDFTAGGVMLNAQIRGDIPGKVTVTCKGKVTTTLMLQPGGTMSDLNGPADLAVRRDPNGAQLVVIPELFARDATPGDDEVTVLALPAGFDAACARDVAGLEAN